jgi:predicted CoA-substrate-specific enzyme activase
VVAGIDAGTECVKVVILDVERTVIGRSVVPARGSFQVCIQEAMGTALEEAQISARQLRAACTTGFAASCSPLSTLSACEPACHARGAFSHLPRPGTVIDVSGREPKVIHVGPDGRSVASRSVRKCAVGIGTFLMFTARHLDVHPTRLMDLAVGAEKPARVGSYCSVFAEVEIIELLRRGVSLGEIALGAMHSVADRILEVGGIEGPVTLTGGVCEYFPGVTQALRAQYDRPVDVAPEPILCGALGAALYALDSITKPEVPDGH